MKRSDTRRAGYIQAGQDALGVQKPLEDDKQRQDHLGLSVRLAQAMKPFDAGASGLTTDFLPASGTLKRTSGKVRTETQTLIPNDPGESIGR